MKVTISHSLFIVQEACHSVATSTKQGCYKELSPAGTQPLPFLQHIWHQAALDLPEQLQQDREPRVLPASSLDIRFPLPLPAQAGTGWSFPSSVAGKWEKGVRCPGYRPDCTLFSADSSLYPEAEMVDFCAEGQRLNLLAGRCDLESVTSCM